MIRKIIILLGVSAFLFTACQKDEEMIPTQEDMGMVSFSLSLPQGIENGTEYVPMATRATESEIKITNTYNYIIAKKTDDGRYVVANVGEANLDKNYGRYATINIKNDLASKYENFNILLRPGEYEMLIFTGAYAVKFNDQIKVGTVLPGPTDTEKLWAIQYETSTFPENYNDNILTEEVFFGRKVFTVEKTNYLSDGTTPNIIPINIDLERRVSKFRILIKETISPTIDKPTIKSIIGQLSVIINAEIEEKNGDNFPSGLDIWGNLWTDSGTSFNSFKFFTQVYSDPQVADDGLEYYIGNGNGRVRIYHPYLFSMPGEETNIKIGKVDCTTQSSIPNWIFDLAGKEFSLKHNTINGFVLQMTENWSGKYRVLEPVLSGSDWLVPDNRLLENNYEYGF